MSENRGDQRPTPEQLTAYVDGELAEEARRAVEDWLAGRPNEAAATEAEQRLRQLMESSAASEPSAAEWAMALTRIEAGLSSGRKRGRPAARRVASLLWAAAALAASAMAMWVVFAGNAPPVLTVDKQIAHEAAEVEPPFPVLLADEVDIMTIQAIDTTALVVGVPPVHEPLVLAAASEITLDRVEPDVDGMMPDMRWFDGSSPPMIAVPLAPK